MSEITNDHMEYLRSRLVTLDNQKRMPIPTPNIGSVVLFFPNGNAQQAIAAMVTRQDSPGVVGLELFQHAVVQREFRYGVHYKDHPFLEANENLIKMKLGGCWDYCEGERPIARHGNLHVKEIERQIAAVESELRTERQKEIQRRVHEEEQAAKPQRDAKQKTAQAT